MTNQPGLFDAMPIHISDSPAYSTPPSDAGFHLDRQEAQAMLASVRALYAQAADTLKWAEPLTHLTPPAADPASRSFNTTAGGPGTGAFAVGLRCLQLQKQYLDELQQRLATALDRMATADEHAGGCIAGAESGTI